jgi:hypothetical protein
MSTRNNLLIAAVLLAVASPALPVLAPAALAEPLVYNPHEPGYHPGTPAYYHRYRVLAPDWFERRDTVTLQAGDAVAANKAMQTRDPWPPYVQNRDIQFHGELMGRAIQRYKTDTVRRPVFVSPTLP